jgi:ribosomal protein S18 acetylase RimI-like enzyme
VTLRQLNPAQAEAFLPGLVMLLKDSVESGASVGFLPPLSESDAMEYWRDVISDMRRGSKVLLVALEEPDTVAGAVQIELASKANAQHRAEVQKLMVRTDYRGQGLGRALMDAVESAAREAGRTLLVLDTRQGDIAEELYLSLGYTLAGVIPQYARSANGELHATSLFYKLLE